MHTTTLLLVLAGAAALAGCNHVEATSNRCGGTTACAKGPCDPIDVLSDRPNRPFRELGVVEVRVDRGTAFKNVTLADAMPALVAEARNMGADAVILTHEEFTSWYDKGEPASPIHDLERQESWYITEKARYVSGLAVVYTAPPCAPPRAGVPMAPSTGRIVSTRIIPSGGTPPSAPVYQQPVPEATPMPPPPAAPAPSTTMPVPTAPVPTAPAAPEPIPAPPPAPDVTVPAPPTIPDVPLVPPAPPAVPEVPKVPDVPPVPPTPDLPPVPRPPEIPPVPPAPPVSPDAPAIPK